MARSARSYRRFSSRQLRSSPYPLSSCQCADTLKKSSVTLEKRDWEDATCSVCMECPHNAVLLLCASHDKGCRPYMCGTSYRHSNCLEQFKKAYAKETVSDNNPMSDNPSPGLTMSSLANAEKAQTIELACPLCRGQVKGWTVVNPARRYLNNKKRTCMQDNCSFVGTYRELRKHVRLQHPLAKPREVDPVLEQNWRALELEREREDVISTIRSSMPRAVMFGDYVIDMNSDADTDDDLVDRDVGGGSRGISRSILYFFLREGARFMRLQRDERSPDREEADDDAPSTTPPNAAITFSSSSDNDDAS